VKRSVIDSPNIPLRSKLASESSLDPAMVSSFMDSVSIDYKDLHTRFKEVDNGRFPAELYEQSLFFRFAFVKMTIGKVTDKYEYATPYVVHRMLETFIYDTLCGDPIENIVTHHGSWQSVKN